MATIGLPGQPVDVLAGDDVDARSGRLLTVAELQRALTLAVGTRTDGRRPAPAVDGAAGPAVTAAPEAREPAACPADPPAELELDPGPDLRWGAAPVPVGPAGDRPVPVGGSTRTRPAAGPAAGGWRPRFPVGELLALPQRDRDRRAGQVLAAGWAGSRRLLVASLAGGVGRSTVAAAVAGAAAPAVRALLLDATGLEESAAAVRVGTGSVSRRPWTWAVDPDAAVHLAALHRRVEASTVPVVALAGDRGTAPPADAVAAAVAAATDFPLVVVDLPAGGPAARAALRAAGPDPLLVLVCRPDPADIDDAADLLQQLGSDDADTEGRAVLAVTPDRGGMPRPVRRRLAAAAGSAAGVLTVPYLPALVSRRVAVTGRDAVLAVGRVLAAAAGAGADRPDRGGASAGEGMAVQ